MNIQGKTLEQIGKYMSVYVAQHINGYDPSTGTSMFQESNLFHYEEVEDLIPEEHRDIFTCDNKFNGACGIFEIGAVEYNIMLLSNEDYSRAYFLWVEFTDTAGKKQTELIKDFI